MQKPKGGRNMVVLTVSAKRKRLLLAGAAVVVVLALLFGIRAASRLIQREEEPGIQTAAATNEERIAFLSQFGWEVKKEAVSVKEVTIPAAFSNVYTEYNQIQLEQGMDLTAYAGCTCKVWTYEVTNYPEKTETVYATLIVYDGQIVAGDISSAALDGFMHGFSARPEALRGAEDGEALPEEEKSCEKQAGENSEAESIENAEQNAQSAEETEPQTSSEVETGAWPTD